MVSEGLPQVKAGILHLVLVIITVMAALIGALLLLSYHSSLLLAKQALEDRLERNAYSGIQWLLSVDEDGAASLVDLYDTGSDTVMLMKKEWGGYELGISTAGRGRTSVTRVAMFGCKPRRKPGTALYLADEGKPLYLSGTASIVGDVFLPWSGIKLAATRREDLSQKIVNGEINQSESFIPMQSERFYDRAQGYLKYHLPGNSKVEFVNSAALERTAIANSFVSDSRVLQSDSELVLGEVNLKGNLVIRSDKSIIVSKHAKLQDVLLVAPYILLEQGASATAQFFAADSIVLQNEVSLFYPSLLCLPSQNGKGVVKIGNQVNVASDIMIGAGSAEKHYNSLHIGQGSTVQGQVYVEGAVEHYGTIKGSLVCSRFIQQTASGMRGNYMQDGIIDIKARSRHYLTSRLLASEGATNALVKWLE